MLCSHKVARQYAASLVLPAASWLGECDEWMIHFMWNMEQIESLDEGRAFYKRCQSLLFEIFISKSNDFIGR
jgi:hypothetical protein